MARRKKQAEGLGDTVEQVLEATGIAKVAKWVMGEDCGCEERKQKLNELFPYNKPECLLEDEYEFLTWWYSETRNQMRPSEQLRILEIYNRTFHKNMQPTSCGSCLRDVLQKLKTLTDEYGK
jgi:hypothetical protein